MAADSGALVGVDGGNSKTIALVAGLDGTVIGSARVDGCADIYAIDPSRALGVIRATLEAALRSAPLHPTAILAAAFSLAGADWPDDIALYRELIGAAWPGLNAIVVNDAIGALRIAIPDGPGVVVVSGVGTGTAARGSNGRVWHSSHWQQPQGARQLGEQALAAVVRTELGIDPQTGLTARILAESKASSVEVLLHRFTSRVDRADVAALAPTLLDLAETGDPTAARLVQDHGAAIGVWAAAAARQVGIQDMPFPFALTGGLFRHRGRILSTAIEQSIHVAAPGARIVKSAGEPAAGALLLAFDAAGVRVAPSTLERLAATVPLLTLFTGDPPARP